VQHHALHLSSPGCGHTPGPTFLTLLLTFAPFEAAANCEDTGESARAEALRKIAAINTAKNFIGRLRISLLDRIARLGMGQELSTKCAETLWLAGVGRLLASLPHP
jgi:hypothetical protein